MTESTVLRRKSYSYLIDDRYGNKKKNRMQKKLCCKIKS